MHSPSPKDVAREAREVLERSKETPDEHFERLVRAGFINARGEVTKLLGGDVDPEPSAMIDGSASGNGARRS